MNYHVDLANVKEDSSRSPPCEVSVLRLGHRLVRDTRMSTHAALVSRAFGAKEILVAGADESDAIVSSIDRVNLRWGGDFKVQRSENWRDVLKNWNGVVVHLTMYGEELGIVIKKIRKDLAGKKGTQRKNLLVVIGAEKVPRELYSLASYNVSIGNQPHSEVAALAVFLDRFFRGKELYSTFSRAKIRIKPSRREKKIEFTVKS